MMADRIVSRQEPGRSGGPRDRGRSVLRRLVVAALLPILLSGGVPYRLASAQPMPVPQQPQAGSGVQENAGRTIQAVEFHGTQALSEETLLFYLGLQIGQPLDEALLNRKIKELWDRSLVDDIRIDAEAAGADTVKLTITVKERPILRSVSY
jgi:outer membrane protein assembly factor BamA